MSLSIYKIGGEVLDDATQLAALLRDFAALAGPKILVHGGGRRADLVLAQMGIEPQMVAGRRLTDAATLEVVTMVYAGLLNKQLTADLQALRCNAIGMSGADATIIRARKRPVGAIDYGFAGDVEDVNATVLQQLLTLGLTPVCCAITHNGAGQLLNTNADTIAATLATALASQYAVRLVYCFGKPGVLTDVNNDNSVIQVLNPVTYQEHVAAGHIADGMLPKLDNAFASLAAGVQEIVIGNVISINSGTATRIVS